MKTLTRPIGRTRNLKQPELTSRFWLALNLSIFRKKMNLTQEKLAKEAGISTRCLNGIEKCVEESNPELKTIEALAKVLKVEVRDLLKVRTDVALVDV